jgi:hypothetical protein
MVDFSLQVNSVRMLRNIRGLVKKKRVDFWYELKQKDWLFNVVGTRSD